MCNGFFHKKKEGKTSTLLTVCVKLSTKVDFLHMSPPPSACLPTTYLPQWGKKEKADRANSRLSSVPQRQVLTGQATSLSPHTPPESLFRRETICVFAPFRSKTQNICQCLRKGTTSQCTLTDSAHSRLYSDGGRVTGRAK